MKIHVKKLASKFIRHRQLFALAKKLILLRSMEDSSDRSSLITVNGIQHVLNVCLICRVAGAQQQTPAWLETAQ